MKSLVFEVRRADELRTRAHAELAENVPQVELDWLLRQVQPHSDLTIRETVADELGHLPLGRRQLPAARRAAADARQLRSRRLHPEGGAELLERRQCLGQRLPRGRPLHRPALVGAEREQCPCTIERHRYALVDDERTLERGERHVVLSARVGRKTAAPACGGERPGAIEHASALLEPAEDLLSLMQPSEFEERLDLVWQKADRTRFAYPGRP